MDLIIPFNEESDCSCGSGVSTVAFSTASLDSTFLTVLVSKLTSFSFSSATSFLRSARYFLALLDSRFSFASATNFSAGSISPSSSALTS